MADWWEIEGEDLRETVTKDYEIPDAGGNFEPLPDNTKVLCRISDAGIEDRDGRATPYVQLEILKHEGFAKHKIWRTRFQILDVDPKNETQVSTKKKHLPRFLKLDAACGGAISRSGKELDEILMAKLINKEVIAHVKLIEPKPGETDNRGEPARANNWISDYAVKGSKELTVPASGSTGGGGSQARRRPDPIDDDMDQDIPFITMTSDW